ncbi:general regulatory factor 5 [Actinidia rufa]|uniref:General regulatory factor 5 n=1 Tax=Actinidia rufa TaxID=165716 RepID=A0A7J0E902_9ERIC|nr:general regulatory factor 5 [Actinidia rufa]
MIGLGGLLGIISSIEQKERVVEMRSRRDYQGVQGEIEPELSKICDGI